MAAAIGLNERAQGLGTGSFIVDDLTASPLMVIQGLIPIPQSHGLGVGALRG
jgi:hypothetical protein